MVKNSNLHYTIIKYIIDNGFAPDNDTLSKLDYSGKNGATHSGAFGASIPVHSAPPPKWRKLGLETGE